MAVSSSHAEQVDARIVYWGIQGAGVTTNLLTIHSKLRADHRGELRHVPTRLDPSVTYELLPIELGQVGGVRTRLQIVGAPSGPDQHATRKQLLDRIDGLVLVIDSRSDRIDANLESYDELRQSLAAYGESVASLPIVLQYNKRDLAESFDIEALHRKLDLRGAAVFEAVATEGPGVLQTLTTISKRVIRALSERASSAARTPAPAPAPAAPLAPAPSRRGDTDLTLRQPSFAIEAPTPAPDPTPSPPSAPALEDAILAEGERSDRDADRADADLLTAQRALDRPWSEVEREAEAETAARLDADLRVLEVGQAEITGDRVVRIPLTLGNDRGERSRLALTVALDPLLDEPPTRSD